MSCFLLWACYNLNMSSFIQRALYNLGLTGIPITNVNNNCSTGSTALYQANTLVKSGLVDCALALGFERMSRGSLSSNFPDRPSPGLVLAEASNEAEELLSTGTNFGPGAPRMFANAGQEHSDKYGSTVEHVAQIGLSFQTSNMWPMLISAIASKNHKHSVNNPYSQFRDGWSVEQVLNAPKVTKQLTKFMCSPTSVGPCAIWMLSMGR